MSVTANLVTNPSFESALSPWTLGIGCPGGLDRVSGAAPSAGSWCAELYKHATNTQSLHYMYSLTRVAVTPGVQYEASCQAIAVTTAGYTAGPKIYWFAGTSGGSSIGTPMSAAASVNTSTWTKSTATGTCPAGAAYAEIRMYTTGQPSNSDVHIDDVIFGQAAVNAVGNLLPYGVQSMESGISGWSNQSNTTDTQSSTFAQAGTYSLAMTATASGDVSALTSAKVAVVAGRRYKSSAWFRAGAGTPNVQTEIQWYDSGSSYLSSATSSLVASSSSAWTQVAVSGATAPAGATQAAIKVWGKSLSAAGVVRVDEVWLGEDPVIPGNLLTSGEASIETAGDNTLWASQANAALTRTTSSPIAGAASLLDTSGAAGASRFALVRKQALTAGNWYSFQLSYKMPSAASFQQRIGVDWYDATPAYLSTTWGTTRATNATGTAGSQFDLFQVPAGAASGSPVVEVTATGAQAFRYDQMTLLTSGAPWTAAVDNTNAAVNLTFSSPAAGGVYTTLSVYRTGADGVQVPVRDTAGDMTQVVVGNATTWAGTDYEPLLGVPIRYTARWQGSGVEDFYAVTEPLTVAEPPLNMVWLKHPGRPALNAQFMVAKAPDWGRKSRSGQYDVVNRKNPVIRSSIRSGHAGDLTLVTETDGDRQAVDALLDDGALLLLQTPGSVGMGGNMYVAIGDTGEPRIGGSADEPSRQFTLPLTEQDRPAGGIDGSATRTWNDLATDPTLLDWGDIQAGFPTWMDVYLGPVS